MKLFQIEARLHPHERQVTIWHEVLHGALRQLGYVNDEVPEPIVEGLSYSIVALLQSNPFLRELP